jgi:UDP-glucose 4-epimerase
MSILVVGGSGFLGGKLVERLGQCNYQSVSYDIIQTSSHSDSVTKWVRGDILDSLSLERLFFEHDVESVAHFIGLPDIANCEKNPQLSFNLNVLSLQNTLEPMRRADVENIIFTSSAAVYGYSSDVPVKEESELKPNTIYGYHKLIAEQMIESYAKSYGMKYTTLRLFNVYGATPSTGKDVISIFIRRALNNQPLIVKGPGKYRDFIHVNDVVDAVCKLISSHPSNRVLNVGTGTKITLAQIAGVVARNFKNAKVIEESAADDGTGIVADISQLRSSIDFNFQDPLTSIEKYVASWGVRS